VLKFCNWAARVKRAGFNPASIFDVSRSRFASI
jgi:hypothetical protein